MTEPTPAELDVFIETHMPAYWQYGAVEQDRMRSLVRTAIAKWGTPPAVAGKPWGACVSGRVFVGGLPEHVRKLAEAENLPIQWLYTTPQPTQAQAGAVPLTREQVKAICVESGYETATLQERADFINGIRHAERHHGIKGDQHGTE